MEQQLVLKVSALSFPFMIYIFSHLNNDSQGKIHLQLLWVQCQPIRLMMFVILTGEGSQGVCVVSPLGHISSPGPLNEITDRVAVQLAVSKRGVKHCLSHLFALSPGPKVMLNTKQRLVQGHPQLLRPAP